MISLYGTSGNCICFGCIGKGVALKFDSGDLFCVSSPVPLAPNESVAAKSSFDLVLSSDPFVCRVEPLKNDIKELLEFPLLFLLFSPSAIHPDSVDC